MSGIEQIPGQCRLKAYDNCGATWRSVAVQSSGEVKIAHGETLLAGVTLAPNKSGGVILGTGVVERVILKVPRQCCSGGEAVWGYSGESYAGVWVGSATSGHRPVPGSGCLVSGIGLFLEPGDQKELYVQNLNEIRVAGVSVASGPCGDMSGILGSGCFYGWPVTYVGEVITC